MAIAETELFTQTRPGMPITEDELLRLPKDGPGNPTAAKYERVNGRLTEVPTSFGHDEIGFNIILLIGPHMRGHGVGSTGQDGFRMANGNVRAPDVSFTRTARIPGGRPGNGFGSVAPDFCVDIILPWEQVTDVLDKMRDYFYSGASLVWHVFPESQSITVWTSATERWGLRGADILDVGDLLPEFSCRVYDIFTEG